MYMRGSTRKIDKKENSKKQDIEREREREPARCWEVIRSSDSDPLPDDQPVSETG